MTNKNYMWDLACSNDDKYIILQNKNIKMDKNELSCILMPTGVAYIKTWMVAEISKKFMFKKFTDIRYKNIVKVYTSKYNMNK